MKKFLMSAIVATCFVGLQAPAFAADEKPDLDTVFKKADKDGDGKLTVEEFVGKRTGEKADKAKATFARLDKDSDGKVTLEEFKDRKKK
jgi:Ca2+-binding EF-hand superfamily protein